jgi:hypothetical protein
LSEMNVYENVTYLKVIMRNLEWDECLCECYISQSKYEKPCECYISQSKYEKPCECYISQSKYEKPWVRWMFMRMLHISK